MNPNAAPLPPASPAPPARADQVRAEQVRILYQQLPVSVTGTMVAVVFLVAVLWGKLPHAPLLVWAGTMLANQSWRLVLYARFRREGLHQEQVATWGTYWAIGSGISGAIWGAASLLFFLPDSPIQVTLLVVVVFAITAVAVPLLSSHMPSFYVFVLPTLLCLAARAAWQGDAPHLLLGFATVAVMLGIISVGRSYNRVLVASLRKGFENQALATRLAEQNAELDRARRVAEEANRAKTQFFAAASHDLRQPLHAMGLFASALADKVRDPEVLGVVSSIDASVHALEGLFNELLDISRIDSGNIRVDIRDFRINEVLERLRGEFGAEAAAKAIGFRIDSPEAVVRSDPVLLERILRNLVSNALRYTVAGEVAVIAQRSGPVLRVEVRDTGVGIPEADQQRIFEEFTQLQNPARTSKKGLGLGLSIVKRLCGLLDYDIRLQSRPGEGSTFGFDVPLGDAQAQSALPAPPAETPRTNLAGRLIVVVDDEEAVVDGMTALLTGWGGDVIGSTTGNDIIARIHAAGRLPDLLIVDFRLGDGDTGITLATHLRQMLDPEIPAVLVTGSITPELETQARQAGLRFLLKPVSVSALARCIESLLSVKLD
jgi:signal transduction histidine kinase/CheY-like chemotaxis protein